jgi:hypothetical protein
LPGSASGARGQLNPDTTGPRIPSAASVAAAARAAPDPRDIARLTADAIIAGDYEILADGTTRSVKSRLSGDLTALYPRLAGA